MYALASAGFKSSGFADGAAFFAELGRPLPSLLLLDIMLPGDDGINILRRIRAGALTRSLPVIMLTAKNSEYDRIRGLDLGADDYVTKPFSVMEVISRVKAVLRRSAGAIGAVGGAAGAMGEGGAAGWLGASAMGAADGASAASAAEGLAAGGTTVPADSGGAGPGGAAGLGATGGSGSATGVAVGSAPAMGSAPATGAAFGTAPAMGAGGAAGWPGAGNAGAADGAGAAGAAPSAGPESATGAAAGAFLGAAQSPHQSLAQGLAPSSIPGAGAGASPEQGAPEREAALSVGNLLLQRDRRTVRADGAEVALTYKEFELLHYLMANEGIVVSRDKLLSKIWGFDYAGETRTVDMHIKSLRQKLGASGALIKTVRNVGYKIGG